MKTPAAVLALAAGATSSLAQTCTSINMYDANALSADGRVIVGMADSRAVYWTRATGLVTLPTGEMDAEATAVSGDGSVIVGNNLTHPNGGNARVSGWAWQSGQPVTLILLANADAYNISCVSRDGSTVGGIVVRRAVDPFYHSTVWNRAGEGRVIPEGSNYSSWLHALSADGLKAVGSGSSGIGTWGVLWNSTYVWCQNIGTPPNTSTAIAYGMSPDGRVVVGEIGTRETSSAFVYTQDGGLELFPPIGGAPMARLVSISDDASTAAGFVIANGGATRSVVWKRGIGLIDATAYFTSHAVVGLPAQPIKQLIGVSANGRVFAGATFASSVYHIDLGPCNSADFNNDGSTGTDQDIEAFFRCLAGTCCAACDSADFNHDGDVGTDADIESFFRVLAGGHC